MRRTKAQQIIDLISRMTRAEITELAARIVREDLYEAQRLRDGMDKALRDHRAERAA